MSSVPCPVGPAPPHECASTTASESMSVAGGPRALTSGFDPSFSFAAGNGLGAQPGADESSATLLHRRRTRSHDGVDAERAPAPREKGPPYAAAEGGALLSCRSAAIPPGF